MSLTAHFLVQLLVDVKTVGAGADLGQSGPATLVLLATPVYDGGLLGFDQAWSKAAFLLLLLLLLEALHQQLIDLISGVSWCFIIDLVGNYFGLFRTWW